MQHIDVRRKYKLDTVLTDYKPAEVYVILWSWCIHNMIYMWEGKVVYQFPNQKVCFRTTEK